MIAIALKIAGKGLLSQIGSQIMVTRFAQKIAKKPFPIIGIELTKFLHSTFFNGFPSRELQYFPILCIFPIRERLCNLLVPPAFTR